MTHRLVALAALVLAAASAHAQGSAFTYQGRLTDGGTPASGPFDFRFVLYDAPAGGSQVGPVVDRDDVAVVDGGFTVPLDFGLQAFVGAQRFLEVSVRPGAATGAYTALAPRQELTPAPSALFSAQTPWSGVLGLPPGFADNEDADALGGLSCASGQIPKWGGASWFCSADEGGTAYAAGAGLQLVSNVFSLALGGVASINLADGAVVESKLDASSVTTPKIANGAVDTSKLADLAVTTGKIGVGAVTGAQIATATIPFGDIGQNGCALNDVIKFNGAVWSCGTDANTTYSAGTGLDLTGTTFGLAAGGVTSTQIADGSIAFADIGANGCLANQVLQWTGAAWVCAAGGTGPHDHAGQSWSTTAATGLAIATNSPAAGSRAVAGIATATTGVTAGVHGLAASSAGAGVLGESTNASNSSDAPGVLGRTAARASAGVEGVSTATDGLGAGVRGHTDGLFAGVHGIGPSYGVAGEATGGGANNLGAGVFGLATGGNTRGVLGRTTAFGAHGVMGENTYSTGAGTGGFFAASSRYGTGVFGWASGPADPEGLPSTGVWGRSNSVFGRGVYGEVTATSGPTVAVWGVTSSPQGLAGYFQGNVDVTGILTRPAELTRIDHPADPENRYLVHAGVTSDEHKNVYDGVVVTDESGHAMVELPSWFEALNRDFRYQLTVVDDGDRAGFVQAKVVRRISGGRFALRTSAPRTEVSWQVTGVRRDRYAERHPVVVERDKPEEERGTYLHAAEWDQPQTRDPGPPRNDPSVRETRR